MNEQDTDKGEVGGSSPPRPTILQREICLDKTNC